MRFCQSILILLAIVFTSCSSSTDRDKSDPVQVTDAASPNSPPDKRRYPIESCIIKYGEEFGGVKVSEKTIYFDNWGMRETVTGTMGGRETSRTLMLINENWITNVDLLGKTGTRLEAKYAEKVFWWSRRFVENRKKGWI